MNKEIILHELERVKTEVIKRKKFDSLIFLMFSDLHSYGIDKDSTLYFIDCLSNICQKIQPDAVIDMGDNFAMLGRERHISNSSLVEEFSKLFGGIKEKINSPLLLINGNHDSIGTDFFKPKFWYDIVNGKYDDGLAHRSGQQGYYYVDYESLKTRLVFLSVPSDSCLDAEYPTPIWAFGKEQIKWLKEVALNTEHNVLLFSHVPFYYRYRGDMESKLEVWNGEKTAFSYVSNLCGWIDDAEEAAEVIKSSNNVVACFSGHAHKDSLWKPYEIRGADKNVLPCHQVVTRNPIPFPWDDDKGVFGISVDIMIFEPNGQKIDIIRFGDGEDRKVL